MVRHLLGVALLTLVVGACSSAPIDTIGQGSTESDEVGTVSLPLTTSTGGVAYRLNTATFTISAPGFKTRVVKPPADEPVHNEVLPIGSYSIQLEKGWVLEKRGQFEKAFSPVVAQLITPNPLLVEITGKVVADAFFGFVTTSGDVSLGKGGVNIRIGVQDCSAYDTYTSTLGGLVADCLGRVDPRDFRVSKDGILSPTFNSCTLDRSRMTPILQLLSLQYRTARLPFAKQCLAGRFETYQTKFANSGVSVCPTWKKGETPNKITPKTIDFVVSQLPDLPAQDAPLPRGVLESLKENPIYTVSLDNAPGQKCETPAACAAICAGGFPGFVVSAEGDQVSTDPPAWQLDTIYMTPSSDPFLRATYYHPMSFYGGAPGVQFGQFARFQPCGPGLDCAPELCSYYAGSHIKTPLQRDCLNDADINTCTSYCGPKLP